MSGVEDSRPASEEALPTVLSPAGPDSLSGQTLRDIQRLPAVEGQDSPQATDRSASIDVAPAGSMTAPPAKVVATPILGPLEGRETSRSQVSPETHVICAAAANFPGGHRSHETHEGIAAGEQAPVPAKADALPRLDAPVRAHTPPAANHPAAPIRGSLLAVK